MSHILHPDAFDATRSVEEQFLDWLAEEDLIAAEFDAIIAAEWPGPPPLRPGRCARGARRPGGPRRSRRRGVAPPGGPYRPRLGGWARQRSPPASAGQEG